MTYTQIPAFPVKQMLSDQSLHPQGLAQTEMCAHSNFRLP